MNRKIITVVSTLALVFSLALCLGIVKCAESDQGEVPQSVSVADVTEPVFEVRQNGEKIGVFESMTDELYMSINTYVFTLPEADRKLLASGFEVSGGEITHVVEDYTG